MGRYNIAATTPHLLVNIADFQLDESVVDGVDITGMVAEGNPSGSLRVLQLRVDVDARVAHSRVVLVHDHRQLH